MSRRAKGRVLRVEKELPRVRRESRAERMAGNATRPPHFVLSAYLDVGPLRYVYFLVVLVLYAAIVCSNVFLVAVICVTRTLREPMYLFLCSLFLNQLYGSLGLFPFLLVQILSRVHTVRAQLCFLQIFCLYSYGGVEFMSLALMSFDRYLAICRPLRYAALMTLARLRGLIAVSWVYPFLVNLFIVYGLTAPLQLCSNVIQKVYCDNYYVVRLSCREPRTNNIFGLSHMFVVIFSLFMLIVFSYVRILWVCFGGSRQTRQKALSTCGPHLASLLNFSVGAFFEILQSRFDLSVLPNMVRVFLSLYWLMLQPLINPLMYGLQLTRIRLVYQGLLDRSQG
ncbi:olfactory receptor 2F1-like [Neosynchiropus ocellatus]